MSCYVTTREHRHLVLTTYLHFPNSCKPVTQNLGLLAINRAYERQYKSLTYRVNSLSVDLKFWVAKSRIFLAPKGQYRCGSAFETGKCV